MLTEHIVRKTPNHQFQATAMPPLRAVIVAPALQRWAGDES